MKLGNWFFRQLVERGLIEEKYEYYTDEQKQMYDQRQEELRKVEAGEEIRPPWGSSNGGFYLPTWDGGLRQAGGDWWLWNIWYRFWGKLNDEQKREYLEKHQAPPEDWYQELVVKRSLGEEERWKWLTEQKNKVETGEEIEPPWITFPISLSGVGWDDYFLERWKLEVWIPFWETLNEEERKAYLEKRQPPSQEWKENITKLWVGKIRKTEKWFERQKFFLENQFHWDIEFIFPPWVEFPKIPAKDTMWNPKFIEKWMKEIWLPLWNEMDE